MLDKEVILAEGLEYIPVTEKLTVIEPVKPIMREVQTKKTVNKNGKLKRKRYIGKN